MRKHNLVLFNFIGYRLQVSVKGKGVDLKGYYEEGKLQSMTTTGVKHICSRKSKYYGHICSQSPSKPQKNIKAYLI